MFLVGGMANAESILVRKLAVFVARRSYVLCVLVVLPRARIGVPLYRHAAAPAAACVCVSRAFHGTHVPMPTRVVKRQQTNV